MNEKNDIGTIPHPRQSANFVSALSFWWTHNLFKTGLKRDIQVEDLYMPLKEHKSSLLGDRFERIWQQECISSSRNKRNPNFLRVMLRGYGYKFLTYGFIRGFLELIVRVAQPLFLGLLLQYFTPGSRMHQSDGYLYGTAVVLCSLLNVMILHPYMMAMFHLGLKMKVSCCSLIYRKVLRLSKSALGQTTVGQVVNLMANDVTRFDNMFIFGHFLWLGPAETVLVTYILWLKIGVSAFGGIICMLLFIPLQGYLGKLISKFRFKTAFRTDDRIRIMNEIISGIQVIKMYAWEKPFANIAQAARKKEVNAIKSMLFVHALTFSMNVFVTQLSTFISIIAYVLIGENITAEKVFVVAAYYNLLKYAMSEYFPKAITAVAEGLVSIRRIEIFLNYEEIKPLMTSSSANETITVNEKTKAEIPYVKLTNVIAKWKADMTESTLNNISLSVSPRKLLTIAGPVGSGKSSLLQVILGELPVISGVVTVHGKVSYDSQEPWLFSASLRQNILFGQPYDKDWYWHVIKACALEEDFANLPHSDKTLVGDRGVMLSGGQKARVNLARAVYRKADIYLLDDPLSAVDPHVAKHIFEACINGVLRNSICILVTHQIQFLHHADEILVLKDGILEAKGSFYDLQQSGLDFAKLLHCEQDDTERAGDIKSEEGFNNSDIQESHSLTNEHPAPQQEAELRTSGVVQKSVYFEYFSAGGNYCKQALVATAFILTPLCVIGGDYWLSYWVNSEELQQQFYEQNFNESKVYSDTDSSISGYAWMLDTNKCIYIYTIIIIATIVITIIRSVSFFNLCINASIRLHNKMFIGVTQTKIQFFNNNPSGRILNRFSKDIGNVDEVLPITIMDCLQVLLGLIGTIIIVAVVNYWTLLPTILLAGIFWLIRTMFLCTSRSVKRLESITRSPVFSHTTSSLLGLTTIRALGAKQILEVEFDYAQDVNSSAYYIFVAISRAFGLWLDFVCVAYLAVVTYSFLILGQDVLGGSVGLAITQSLNLMGMFQWGIRQSAEVINQMTGVERILEFADLKPEASRESISGKKKPIDWPSSGQIVFQNVYLKYSEDDPPVLKDLNFTVKPQAKVGIVGRTGAGKSSLISAIFRLANVDGQILIDGIDLKAINLQDFRPKISIIPQEPVLFSGSLRKNLDPFEEFSDSTIWEALEAVEMKDIVNEMPAGLNCQITEGGSNFSVGQRQLICLARAVIRKNRILILDEATANVDHVTDTLIQQTVRQRFQNCTVLTIAHRLHTIMDSDKVLVLDSGIIKEFDHPHILLCNINSLFYNMVEQTGKTTADELKQTAKESYMNWVHNKSL